MRVSEAERLGFKRIVLPKRSAQKIKNAKIELIAVSSIFETVKLFKKKSE
jgi:predicted ATP-dependent serine protease